MIFLQVHQCILPIRDEKDGWVHLFAPGGVCCNDDGEFFAKLVSKAILKIVFTKNTFLCLKESICGTRENVFYFTSKALFVFEISNFNFSDIQMS